jgi:hypothetical protein
VAEEGKVEKIGELPGAVIKVAIIITLVTIISTPMESTMIAWMRLSNGISMPSIHTTNPFTTARKTKLEKVLLLSLQF